MDEQSGKAAGLDSGSRTFSARRRRAADRAARLFITAGGVAIICSIAAILFFISWEVYPLTKGARAVEEEKVSAHGVFRGEGGGADTPSRIVAAGIDDYQETAWFVSDGGEIRFYSLPEEKVIAAHSLLLPPEESITSAEVSPDLRDYAFALSDGTVMTARLGTAVTYAEGDRRVLTPKVEEGEAILLGEGLLRDIAHSTLEDGVTFLAAVTDGGRICLLQREVEATLFGEGETTEVKHDLTVDLDGEEPREVVFDGRGRYLFATAGGAVYRWRLQGNRRPALVETLERASLPEKVTSAGMLIGGRSLTLGGDDGSVTVWFEVKEDGSEVKRMRAVHRLEPQGAAVSTLAPTVRNRSLLVGDTSGGISLHYVTSRRKLLSLATDGAAVDMLAFTPRADGIIALDRAGTFYHWSLDNPHPELTWKALFGKIWYEGYEGPEYVWQSTGLEDDFEPKLSLVPLIFGTIKGTFYALLFAVPIAILGALCVSQFMHPSIRNTVKPVLEIMAALPSVVLGFVAGLWLAPLVEEKVPAVMLIPPVLIALTLLCLLLWKSMPRELRSRTRDGAELFLLVPAYVGGIALCLWLNDPIENAFMQGEFTFWLYRVLGLSYDQRNSLIVGFAMGFAVIPIIFSISEDALSNVPRQLVSGSLALGATKWQTAMGVVLPTASPGIFSAVMIGLGRAVGETMIVLMATGNTPIMDWNIFNGFRALSANIAVEIPEAPHGGTLYRVLFLAALLLFAMTFVVNTMAEVVRIRLRRKYGQL